MQEGDLPETYLSEMAIKCRRLADDLFDLRVAASLRKLADEYDTAAEAARINQSYLVPPPSQV